MTRLPSTLTRPLTLLPLLAVTVAFAAVAAFMLVPASEAVAAVVAPEAALPVVKAATGRDRSCESCGVVHTITRSDPATGLVTYEFSVRMRDGSTRDSTGATRGSWLEGERVMLIGGTAARALEEEKSAGL
jgi:hypothetical protein